MAPALNFVAPEAASPARCWSGSTYACIAARARTAASSHGVPARAASEHQTKVAPRVSQCCRLAGVLQMVDLAGRAVGVAQSLAPLVRACSTVKVAFRVVPGMA